ncbi:hypothetical protein GALMADRAFT_139579 [Galerina marginata CBS 339.88]|uniref:F-box domain-containing protein n=1 Tax=Galerina marginata (strain CBS 339.88) TaxID=685588 RepID=A0A067T0F3_GALM3|nr:hypothetical protein GALMADRAFT_139579 [Galerina marginata CBS 339.88]
MTHASKPVEDIPLDILQEIFIRCLPQDAMTHRQPNITITPILLCHVSSYWRMVALGIPRLWTDLYHVLRVYAEVPNRTLLSEGIHKGDLNFLSWWKLNIGTVHLRLRVMVQWVKGNSEFKVGKSDGSLLSLVSAARHLDIDIDFACALRTHFGGNLPDSTLRADTFLLHPGSRGFRDHSNKFPFNMSRDPKLIPYPTDQPVRRMLLDSISFKQQDLGVLNWSQLTHLILIDAGLSAPGWSAMIRECGNLESGTFRIRGRGSGHNQPVQGDPPSCTLPRLQQLVVKWDSSNFPHPLFRNLYLPGLTRLRLASALTVRELHELLRSTPSVQELHLSHSIPANPDFKSRGLIPRPSANVDELTVYVPDLEHLVIQLDFTYNKEYEDVSHLLEVLSTTPWLKLGSGRNAIKRVELIVEHWESREILVEGLKTLNPVIDEVEIIAREDSPWRRDTDLHLKYSLREDCFDNFGFGYE